jgi:Na+-transporting NADH:ubiquinone oxidoreductase subunit C
VAVPFAGQGLWGPIKGFLALKPDLKTIHGVTFHEQEETPGLGGEIGADWFRDQFKGKSIEDAQGKRGIRIRRGGGATGPNEVDAITGATMTSERVEEMLNAAVARIAGEDIGHAH